MRPSPTPFEERQLARSHAKRDHPRVLDGWSDAQRTQIEELAEVIEQHSENDDWEWCLGDAEAIYKAGWRRICAPVERPF